MSIVGKLGRNPRTYMANNGRERINEYINSTAEKERKDRKVYMLNREKEKDRERARIYTSYEGDSGKQ